MLDAIKLDAGKILRRTHFHARATMRLLDEVSEWLNAMTPSREPVRPTREDLPMIAESRALTLDDCLASSKKE